MDKISGTIIAVISGVLGLAVISVILSSKAQTPAVLGAAGAALSSVIGAAVAPVTGTSPSVSGNPLSIGVPTLNVGSVLGPGGLSVGPSAGAGTGYVDSGSFSGG